MFYILIIIGVAILGALSIHFPPGNTEFEKMLDKAVEYVGVLAIPLVIFWWANREQRKKDELDKLEKKKEEAEQKILLEKHKNNLLIIYDELLVYFKLIEERRNRENNMYSKLPIYKQKFAQYLPQLLLELYNPIDSKFYNKLFIFLGILNEEQTEFNIPFDSTKEADKYLHQIIQEINNNEYDHSIIKFIQNNTKNID